MKTISTIVLFIFFMSIVSAQTPSDKELKKHFERVAESKNKGKVIVSLDTIYNKGIAYAVLKSKKRMLMSDYTLYSLNGTELADIQWEQTDDKQTVYYAYLFLQSGKRGEVKRGFSANIEETVVENDLVKDNQVNPAGENKFLMKYPPKFSGQSPSSVVVVNNDNSGSGYETVERNRNVMIQVFGNDIKQDFKLIGTFSKTSEAGNGKILNVISIFLPNGTKIAEATQQDTNSKSYRLVTMKDNKTFYITATFIGQEVNDIAKFLSGRYYL